MKLGTRMLIGRKSGLVQTPSGHDVLMVAAGCYHAAEAGQTSGDYSAGESKIYSGPVSSRLLAETVEIVA